MFVLADMHINSPPSGATQYIFCASTHGGQ